MDWALIKFHFQTGLHHHLTVLKTSYIKVKIFLECLTARLRQ